MTGLAVLLTDTTLFVSELRTPLSETQEKQFYLQNISATHEPKHVDKNGHSVPDMGANLRKNVYVDEETGTGGSCFIRMYLIQIPTTLFKVPNKLVSYLCNGNLPVLCKNGRLDRILLGIISN